LPTILKEMILKTAKNKKHGM